MKRIINKRLLPIVIAICLNFTGTVAWAENTLAMDDSTRSLLEAVGVYDSNADYSAIVTRSQFADMILKITNYEGSGIYSDKITDTLSGSAAHRNFSLLAELGAVTPQNGMVRPDESITGLEALKITLGILGYDDVAKTAGDWPDGYKKLAFYKKLLDGANISLDDNVKVFSAYKLIYNALYTNISDLELVGRGEPSVSGRFIYMEQVLHIYETRGIVTDDGITTLVGESTLKKGKIRIGEKIYDNKTELSDCLGMYIKGYYKISDESDYPVLLSAFVPESKNKVTVISGEDIVDFDGVEYIYEDENGRTRKGILGQGFNVIYNGKAISADEYNRSIMKPVNGKVKLIDNGEGNKTVKVYSYITVVTEYIDSERMLIYDKLGKSTVCFKEAEVRIVNTEGDTLSVYDISQGDVLSVAESFDKTLINILLSREKIQGRLDSVYNNERYAIGSEEYKLTYELKNSKREIPAPGDTGTAYITYDGRLAYFDKAPLKVGGYAYILAAESKEDFGDSLYVKMFTEYGTTDVLKVSNKCRVDGVKVKPLTKTAFVSAVTTDGVFEQLIKYELNSDLEISSIDTEKQVLGENETTLSVFKRAKDKSFVFKGGSYFGGKVAINGDTRIFLVPIDGDHSKYCMGSTANFLTDRSYKITAFKESPTAAYASAIVYKTVHTRGRDVTSVDSFPAIVKAVTAILDDDQMPVYKVETNEFGTESSFITADLSDLAVTDSRSHQKKISIDCGDIIRYGLDSEGRVTPDLIELVYDADEDVFYDNSSVVSSDYNAAVRIVKALPIDFDKNMLVAVDAALANDEENYENYNMSSAKVLIYETVPQNLKVGTKNDILTFNQAGEAAPAVFIMTRSSSVRSILIVR